VCLRTFLRECGWRRQGGDDGDEWKRASPASFYTRGGIDVPGDVDLECCQTASTARTISPKSAADVPRAPGDPRPINFGGECCAEIIATAEPARSASIVALCTDESTVDVDHRPCTKSLAGAGEPTDSVGDFFWPARASERDIVQFVLMTFGHRCRHVPGASALHRMPKWPTSRAIHRLRLITPWTRRRLHLSSHLRRRDGPGQHHLVYPRWMRC